MPKKYRPGHEKRKKRPDERSEKAGERSEIAATKSERANKAKLGRQGSRGGRAKRKKELRDGLKDEGSSIKTDKKNPKPAGSGQGGDWSIRTGW